jgi:hypothetical protein
LAISGSRSDSPPSRFLEAPWDLRSTLNHHRSTL